MVYTPPVGNAVLLNFLGAYTAPPGGSVTINFGGAIPPTPPAGAAQNPTGIRLARIWEDDWFFSRSSRFAPPTAPIVLSLRMRSPTQYLGLLEDEWMPPARPTIRFIPSRRRRRQIFTVV